MSQTRRDLLKRSLLAAGSGLALGSVAEGQERKGFRISLDEPSLGHAIRGRTGERLGHLDFAKVAKEKCGIDAVGYYGPYFEKPPTDAKYLAEMNKRAADHGVTQLLIMPEREGFIDDPDARRRKQAIENHYKWVEAAETLGCHSIRVNAGRSMRRTPPLGMAERAKLAVDGLTRLAEFSAKHKVSVIVENHGGASSNGKWLAQVMRQVNSPFCGTLPDFGNFRISDKLERGPWTEEYDRYQGIKELMPFAKSVSAKSHHFDAAGNETHTDYDRMLKIVLDAGYHGHLGIEYMKYEASQLGEIEGILATKRLLERVREKLRGS